MPSRPKILPALFVVSAVLLGLLPVTPARGQSSKALQPQLTPVAEKIARILKDRDETALRKVELRALQREAGTGPGLAARLIPELDRLGIKISERARLGLKGEFRVAPNQRGLLSGQIELTLVDAAGKKLSGFKTEVQFHGTRAKPGPDSTPGDLDGITAIAAWTAPTVELPPDQSLVERAQVYERRQQDPTVFLDGARVKSSKQSPYAVEVVVEGRPRAANKKEGRAFVALDPDEIYAVRLINDSDRDAAVVLTIDGLNVFTFSEKGEGYVHIMVPPHKSALIRGWYRGPAKVNAFKVTGYAKSPAAHQLIPVGKVGTITAMFAAAWSKDTLPPDDERAANLVRNRGDPVATGRGPQIGQSTKVVERSVGAVRSVVSIHYARK